jgi:hypothetical protein
MDTIYYEVVPVGVQWAMKVAGHDRTWCYPTQDQALTVAVNAARHLWELSGLSTGVRLQLSDGNWQSGSLFGPATPASDTLVLQETAAPSELEGCARTL